MGGFRFCLEIKPAFYVCGIVFFSVQNEQLDFEKSTNEDNAAFAARKISEKKRIFIKSVEIY